MLLIVCVVAAGCAVTPRPAPISQADVISMVKAGATDEEIMRRIDATGTVFRLNADDIVFLRKEGVSDRVVTFMMDTLTRAALAEQSRQDYYRYHVHYGFGWGHPWCW